jgi:hypothetical protein
MAGKRQYREEDAMSLSHLKPKKQCQKTSHRLPDLELDQFLTMGAKLMTELITESFDHPQTAASNTLKQAAMAYHDGEMIKSANLFLKCWRILHAEHLNYLGGRYELLPSRRPVPSGRNKLVPSWKYLDDFKLTPEDLARECQARVQMGHCVLADLARACLLCTGEYKYVDIDGYYSYTLDQFGIRNKDYGQTTTDELEVDGKTWPRGSRVYQMFRLVDDIGIQIIKGENFAEAAHSFANHGLYQLPLWRCVEKEHYEFNEVIGTTLQKIKDLGMQKFSQEMDINSGDKEMEY